MSNAEYVKSVLMTCPIITDEVGDIDLHISQIDTDPVNYSIEAEPTEQIVKRYLGGDSVKRFTFSLLARKQSFTDADRAQNSDVYDQLSQWLETQTRLRKLPPMDGGKTPQSMIALGNGYVLEGGPDNNNMLYQCTCELIYLQEVQ